MPAEKLIEDMARAMHEAAMAFLNKGPDWFDALPEQRELARYMAAHTLRAVAFPAIREMCAEERLRLRLMLDACHDHLHGLTAIIPGNDRAYERTTDLMRDIREELARALSLDALPAPDKFVDDGLALARARAAHPPAEPSEVAKDIVRQLAREDNGLALRMLLAIIEENERLRAAPAPATGGGEITTSDAAAALRRAGAEIWSETPQDDDAVVVTFGLVKRLLSASSTEAP